MDNLTLQQKLDQIDAALDQLDLEDAPFAKQVLLERYRKVDAELAEQQQEELNFDGEQKLV